MGAKTLILTLGVAILGTGSVLGAERVLHFGLSRSEPAADATVPSPAEVRLWFTQVAQPGSVTIRVVDAAGSAVSSTDAAPNADDGRVYQVTMGRRLAAGAYTVSWRGIGDDGHTVRGEFRFGVRAE